jgi:hypothetical protein
MDYFALASAVANSENTRIQTEQTRSAVDDLLLALDLGFAQIEMAQSLEDAQHIAANLRAAMKDGWA